MTGDGDGDGQDIILYPTLSSLAKAPSGVIKQLIHLSLFLSLPLQPHLKPPIFGTNRNFASNQPLTFAHIWDASAHPYDRGIAAIKSIRER